MQARDWVNHRSHSFASGVPPASPAEAKASTGDRFLWWCVCSCFVIKLLFIVVPFELLLYSVLFHLVSVIELEIVNAIIGLLLAIVPA